jgi:hypothetical protein
MKPTNQDKSNDPIKIMQSLVANLDNGITGNETHQEAASTEVNPTFA